MEYGTEVMACMKLGSIEASALAICTLYKYLSVNEAALMLFLLVWSPEQNSHTASTELNDHSGSCGSCAKLHH